MQDITSIDYLYCFYYISTYLSGSEGFEPFDKVGPVTLKDFSLKNSEYSIFILACISRK